MNSEDWRLQGQERFLNPKTDESLHPDLNHPEGIEPHWNHMGPDGPEVRIFQMKEYVPE